MSELTNHDLLERIARLENAVEALTLKLKEEIEGNVNIDRLNTELRRLIERDVSNAFERIKNIELKFFPNLARDLVALHKIVGDGEDKAWNPLDRRPPQR